MRRTRTARKLTRTSALGDRSRSGPANDYFFFGGAWFSGLTYPVGTDGPGGGEPGGGF
jgi:hypothetical protein